MHKEKIVHFVRFETRLNSNDFLENWEQFSRSADSDLNVTVHQSERNGLYNYIAQHHCDSSGFRFFYEKRSTRGPRSRKAEMSMEMAGGYLMDYSGKRKGPKQPGNSLFIFLSQTPAGFDSFREKYAPNLHIYSAYYENCKYSNILEILTDDSQAEAMMQELNADPRTGATLYKCSKLNLLTQSY